MSKHTPGPWTVFVRPATKTLELQAKSKPIVHWTGFDQADQEGGQKVANAHLMAAAPDMLDALRFQLAAVNDLIREHEVALTGHRVSPHFHACLCNMRDDLEAAITKAEGQGSRVLTTGDNEDDY